MKKLLYNRPRKNWVSLLGLLLLFTTNVLAQQSTVISGKVIDETTNQPLVGVSVSTKDQSSGTVTGEDGSYSFETTLTPPFIIVVDFPGYGKKEIEYTGPETNLQFSLATTKTETTPSDTTVTTEETGVTITARRRNEKSQEVPIPISVVGAAQIEQTGAFNVNRVKELVPSVQLYSSNPRNTTLNIRGLGSTFGLTNDGIDPGVGFYIDGVYYARPAAAALDFIDVEQIEVLRGPQGTLFGKNTTSGAFNITTKKPSFKPGANFELSYGNYGYIQAKTSITGPLIKNRLAARVSFSGTQRDGLIYNVRTQQHLNDINNLGVRGQVLFTPSDKVKITLAGDATRQRPNGYAQVIAGVVQTQRASYRQFNNIIKDLNYTLPSTNAFDRVVDHDTPWKSGNDLGGASLNVDAKIGNGTLTSTTAWRYWAWDPSNDRDFTGLSVLRLSQGTSKQSQFSQEIRYAGNITDKVSGVVGVFAFDQTIKSDPVQIEEAGSAQWRFSQSSTSSVWATPGLLDGYGIKTTSSLKTFSGAVFAQADWEVLKGLHILPGIRYNYDRKDADYSRVTYGGLQTTDPALIAIKKSVYSDQRFEINNANNTNFSGQGTIAYKPSKKINAFVTYANSYKPIGVNIGGLPTANGAPMLELATVKPEYVTNYEAGVKFNPTSKSTLNVTAFNTEVKDYQTQVQSPELGVNRGYLSNAEKVRVQGVEVDGNIKITKYVSLYGAVTYTDGKYVKFTNAPLPLEETGAAVSFKDISGGKLPGISKWAGSIGGEVTTPEFAFFGLNGKLFLGFDSYHRSSFSSSPSPSKYLNIDGYSIYNARFGFRAVEGLSLFVWSRNLTNKNYFEQLLPAGGNAGQYAAVLGDQRTFGVTLRQSF